MEQEKFETGYEDCGVEKEIQEWNGKTIKTAKVKHLGADGKLTIEFTDGTIKSYGYNDLGFWEEI